MSPGTSRRGGKTPGARSPLLAYVEGLDPDLAQLSDLFYCLSDPTRLRILLALMEGERCVSELAEQAGVSESAVSHQLRLLRAREVIRSRREGRRVFVSLSGGIVEPLVSLGLDHIRGES